jgi:hypothetical protein
MDVATPTSPDYIKFGGKRVQSEEHHFSETELDGEFDFARPQMHNDDRADNSIGFYQRTSFDEQTHFNPQDLRNSLRMEQRPARLSMEGVRTSMEIPDLTTAGGLMRIMSNNQQNTSM